MGSRLNVRSTFEPAFLGEGRLFWIFWPGLAVLLWAAIELASEIADEKLDLGTRLFVLCFVWMPVPLVGMARYFETTMTSVWELFWADKSTFDRWLIDRAENLLTLRSRPAKVITGLIAVAAIATLSVFGFPYDSLLLSIPVLISVLLVFWIYAQSAYMVIGLIHTLYELSQAKLQVTFFFPPSRKLSPLLNFYTTLAFVLTWYHLTLVASLWTGPYELGAATFTASSESPRPFEPAPGSHRLCWQSW